jgi:hypothetical protein
MKPAVSTVVATLIGIAVCIAIVLAAWHLRGGQTPSAQLLAKARRLEVVSRMRRDLTAASEAEKSAVMATTDCDSQTFADAARAGAAEVERGRAELDELLQAPGERALLRRFGKAFVELRRIDQELLGLAVRNTNIKAYALAFGPAAAALREMDQALAGLIAKNADSNRDNSKKIILLAGRAQGAALRIATLLPPHIAEESDFKMDELEAVMAKEDEQARKSLDELAALLPSDENRQSAAAGYARFSELKKQILTLSRQNTNVRSLSISLNEKRRVLLECEDTLNALEKAIESEPIPGLAAPRPR